ncbi:MAG: hypothetical protein WCD86_07750 [Ktedonobacteraceae bacterium]
MCCAKGSVRFQTLEGNQQVQSLCNVNLIEVGMADTGDLSS